MNLPKTSPCELIFATESPYKVGLLRKILPQFESIAAQIDESPTEGESPYELARRLAAEKAEAVLASIDPAISCTATAAAPVATASTAHTRNVWVLGCDQVAILQNNRDSDKQPKTVLLNKPGSFEQARAQLAACSGKRVEFYTACSLAHAHSNTAIHFTDNYFLHFKQLDDAQITRYLRREEPYDCAGSIKSEGLGVLLIEKFEGSDPNTLIGLPLIKLVQQLETIGFALL